jgi:hypothetical protein
MVCGRVEGLSIVVITLASRVLSLAATLFPPVHPTHSTESSRNERNHDGDLNIRLELVSVHAL